MTQPYPNPIELRRSELSFFTRFLGQAERGVLERMAEANSLEAVHY